MGAGWTDAFRYRVAGLKSEDSLPCLMKGSASAQRGRGWWRCIFSMKVERDVRAWVHCGSWLPRHGQSVDEGRITVRRRWA